MSIAKERIDWKKIRDKDAEYESQISHDIDDEQSNKAFAAQNGHRNRSFPSLISALEDQEKESKSDKERIEFLEKALEQALSDGPDWGSTGPELAKYLEEKNG